MLPTAIIFLYFQVFFQSLFFWTVVWAAFECTNSGMRFWNDSRGIRVAIVSTVAISSWNAKPAGHWDFNLKGNYDLGCY